MASGSGSHSKVNVDLNAYRKPGGVRFLNPISPPGASSYIDGTFDIVEAGIHIQRMASDPSADLFTCLIGDSKYPVANGQILEELLAFAPLDEGMRLAAFKKVFSSSWQRPLDVLLERVILACKIELLLTTFMRVRLLVLVRKDPYFLWIEEGSADGMDLETFGHGLRPAAALVDAINSEGSSLLERPSWIHLAALRFATEDICVELDRALCSNLLTVDFLSDFFVGRKGMEIMMRSYAIALSRAARQFGIDPVTKLPTEFMNRLNMYLRLSAGRTLT